MNTICSRRASTTGLMKATSPGVTFARAIQEEALESGQLAKAIPINPITTDDYPTPAARPAYSVLNNTKLAKLVGIEPTPWRRNLKLMLSRL